MTDILPPAGWPNVRQLETNEFATGGANGNMNEQAKSLAARSELLKQYAALPYESKTGGYALNERVQLANGDVVKSTIPNNINDPNVDMTGWVNALDASFIFDGNENQHQINNSLIRTYNSVSDLLSIPNPRHGQVAFVRHYDLEQGILDGGGIFVYQNTNQLTNDGGYIFNGWTRKLERPIFTPEMFGAKGDLSKDDAPNIHSCVLSARTNKIKCIQFHNKYLIDSARIAGQETLLAIIPNCSFLGFGDANVSRYEF